MSKFRLLPFQEYILKTCYLKKGKKIKKAELFDYFKVKDRKSKGYQNIHSKIIKTIDSLIKKGLVIGFGWRTQKEWHYREIKLTVWGKKKAQQLLAMRKLPL
jgi:hypothetical protein